MTERLYYDDAYRTRFEARVVARADEGRRLYLDRSAFYPTSGGSRTTRGRWRESPSSTSSTRTIASRT